MLISISYFSTLKQFVIKDVNFIIFHLYGTPNQFTIRYNRVGYSRKSLQGFVENFARDSTKLFYIWNFAIFVFK